MKQSYDVTIECMIMGTTTKSTNSLDLKNPYFRYTGVQPPPPPGENNQSPSEAYWTQVDMQGARQVSPLDISISRWMFLLFFFSFFFQNFQKNLYRPLHGRRNRLCRRSKQPQPLEARRPTSAWCGPLTTQDVSGLFSVCPSINIFMFLPTFLFCVFSLLIFDLTL